MDTLQEAPKEIYTLYLQTASNIISHVDDPPEKQMLKELTEMVEESCMLDSKLKQSFEILKRLSTQQNEYDQDQEAVDHQEILEQFKNEVAGINTDVSKNKKFLDFKQQVQTFLDDAESKDKDNADDDELVLTQNQMNVIDPITKKRMIDPVKNTVCGHVYDRDSVQALLEGNQNTRCPVVGCRNKDYIKMDNLQTDIITKRYLDRNPE